MGVCVFMCMSKPLITRRKHLTRYLWRGVIIVRSLLQFGLPGPGRMSSVTVRGVTSDDGAKWMIRYSSLALSYTLVVWHECKNRTKFIFCTYRCAQVDNIT